jgi:hypothetical protein
VVSSIQIASEVFLVGILLGGATMRARTVMSRINTGTAARDFIQLAQGGRQSTTIAISETATAEAAEILESFRSHRRGPDPEFILNGNRVIRVLDEQLKDYRSAGEQFADSVTRGSHLAIPGDDRRFTVMEIWWEDEAIRVQDDEGHEYLLPFKVIRPWPKESDE